MKYKNIVRLFDCVNKALFLYSSKMTYERTLVAVERLVQEIANTDTEEDVWYIGENEESDLSSLIIGTYWFLTDYHGGQESVEYRVFSAVGNIYSPGMSSGVEQDTSEQYVYDMWELLIKELKCQKS